MAVDAGTIYAEIRIQLDKLTGDIQSVQKSFDQFAQQNKKQAEQTSESWVKGAQNMKLEQVAAFAAISVAVGKAVEAFSKFESAMVDVEIKSKATGEELAAMEETTRGIGQTTSVSAELAAKALELIVGAGYDAAQAIEVLNATTLLAEATNEDATAVAKTMTTTLKMFGLASSDAAKLTNVFAATVKNSNATVTSLSAGLHAFGPAASSMGISIEELSAVIGVLSQAGYEGSEAGMALRNVFGSLANETDPMVQKLQTLGIAFANINPATNSLASIIGALADSGMNASDAMDIFGNRVGAQMLALMKAGKEGVEDFTKSVTGTSAAAEMAAKHDETLAEKMEVAQNAIKVAGAAIMESLAPALKILADLVTGVANVFSGLPGPVKLFVAIAAGGIPVVISLAGAFTLLGGVLSTVALPITLIVGGIAAIAAGTMALKGAIDKADTARVEERYAGLAAKLGLTAQQIDDVNDLLLQNFMLDSRSAEEAAQIAQDLSEYYKITKLQLLEIAVANEEISEENREQLKILRDKEAALEKSVKASDEAEKSRAKNSKASREQEAADKKKAEDDAKAAAKAAQDAAKKVIDDQIAGRKAAEAAYREAMRQTELQTKLGLLTTEETSKKELDATNGLIDALIKLGYTGEKNGEIGNRTMTEAIEDRKELLAALETYADAEEKKIEAEKKAAEAKAELDQEELSRAAEKEQANTRIATAAADYTDKLERMKATAIELIELDRQKAIQDVRTSGVAEGLQEIAIANINKYYDALKDTEANEEFVKNLKSMLDTSIGYFDQFASALIDLLQTLSDNRMKIIDEQLEDQLAVIDEEEKAALEAAGVAEETELERLQHQLADAQAAGDAETAAELEDEIKRTEIKNKYEEERVKAEADTKRQAANEEYNIQKTVWGWTFAKAIADAAAAIIKLYSTFDPITASIMLIPTGITTGLQIANIMAQEPKPPSFITGGIVLPSNESGTLVNTAEGGSAELLLNNSAAGRAMLEEFAGAIAQQLASVQGGILHLIMNIDGKVICDFMTEASFDKRTLTFEGALVR